SGQPNAPARRPRRRTPGAALAVLLAGALGACTTPGANADGGEDGFVSGDGQITAVAPDERDPAPAVSGATVGGGEQLDLASFRGRVVVLNVWASWCAPCRAEAPDLVRAAERTSDVAQFVGINVKEENPAAEEAFLRAMEVTYPNLDDPTGEIQLAFADTLPPAAIPSTLVVDAEGRVAARVLGPVTETTLVDLVTDVAEGR
ncbi:TlpA family protein disulfide reductase, partial [Desertihabitans aurantiacus]|uniref:TlpA family protein disulfide reductase n=1 Tax=Desertihabitans aurantiacus TaxID=2282477 RepID=UPI0018E59121